MFMRKEYVVSMSPVERINHRKSLIEAREILIGYVETIEGEEKFDVWARIRKLNDVINIFED
jgi:hypothetical protein